MKPWTLLAAALVSVAMVACGGGDSTETTEPATEPASSGAPAREKDEAGVEVEKALKPVGNVLVPPKVRIPPGPPPEELVVREVAHVGGVKPIQGDLVGVQYVGLDYESGKVFEQRWGPKNLYRYRWGSKEIPKSWQIGFTDVEVGDRRELLVPESLSEGKGPQLYVIEIVEVEWPRK